MQDDGNDSDQRAPKGTPVGRGTGDTDHSAEGTECLPKASDAEVFFLALNVVYEEHEAPICKRWELLKLAFGWLQHTSLTTNLSAVYNKTLKDNDIPRLRMTKDLAILQCRFWIFMFCNGYIMRHQLEANREYLLFVQEHIDHRIAVLKKQKEEGVEEHSPFLRLN